MWYSPGFEKIIMRNNTIKFVTLTPIIFGLSLLGACSDKSSEVVTSAPQAVTAEQAEGTVARV